MAANNWSAHLLAIQRAVKIATHYANVGNFDIAITFLLSIEQHALRATVAIKAEQQRRAELEQRNGNRTEIS